MGDVEGAGHSQSQTGKGLFLGLRNGLDQRSQQDQGRVGEDGNGDQEAGNGQCNLLILAVQRLDEGVCHDLGGVGLLHDLTHHTAKGNHKADSGQRVAEARGDEARDAGKLDASRQCRPRRPRSPATGTGEGGSS